MVMVVTEREEIMWHDCSRYLSEIRRIYVPLSRSLAQMDAFLRHPTGQKESHVENHIFGDTNAPSEFGTFHIKSMQGCRFATAMLE